MERPRIADPPLYGGRLFQRVTVAFDPQEGEARLVEPGHYLFTHAIGNAMSLTITP